MVQVTLTVTGQALERRGKKWCRHELRVVSEVQDPDVSTKTVSHPIPLKPGAARLRYLRRSETVALELGASSPPVAGRAY